MARISVGVVHVGASQFASAQNLRNEFRQVLTQAAKIVELDYRKTFRTWNHKPKVTTTSDGTEAIEVGIDRSDEAGRIWGYVNDGTEPHVIRPVRARRLRFRTGGSPKTQVGVIGAGPGVVATQGPVFATEVHHPGFAGRDFEGAIADKNEETVSELLDAALARLAR